MGKSGGGTTVQSPELPAELRSLANVSSNRILGLQGNLPLEAFESRRLTTPFRTADTAPQFQQAQNQIGAARDIAGQDVGSRRLLGNRPGATTNASTIARQAQEANPQGTPGSFRSLVPTAQRRVGIQDPEQTALDRSRRIGGIVGRTPEGFGQTLNRFEQGINPLQQLAGSVPGQFGDIQSRISGLINGPASNQVDVNLLTNKGRVRGPGVGSQAATPPQQVSGIPSNALEGLTRGPDFAGRAAEPPRGLIPFADQQVTGANIQDSPSFRAAISAFEDTILPTVQNSAALSGLGRSTGLQQSLGAAQAQFLLPVIQGELAREERGIDRGLGARQFGIGTEANLGLQGALAEERGVQRGTDIGRFGLSTAADLGLQEALGEERAIGRRGQAEQFTAGLEADTGRQLAGRLERGIDRELNALQQTGLADERGIQRGQDAARFRAGIEQAAGQQDLSRVFAALGADERTRDLEFNAAQASIPQLAQLGQIQQGISQGALDRDTQDFLRQQALAEQALFQPFGQVAPSTIGQSASTSGGGKKPGK